MIVEKTSNIHVDDNIVMILYGRGGVGKTTFAATAPKPLIIDFENGTKFLGERGLDVDVIRMAEWFTEADKHQLDVLLPKYDTIILDPIGEAMEKLISSHSLDGKKFRQGDGSLSMAGWGEAKKRMKGLVKWLRDSGKNVILVAHVAEGKDEERTTYRIQIPTKLSDELPTMVDIISYMGVRKDADGNKQVVLYTPAQVGNYDSKDRTGRLPEIVPVSEHTGWQDFIAAMGNAPAPKPAAQKQPEPEPAPAVPEEPAPAAAQAAAPTDARLVLEQLLDDHGIELRSKTAEVQPYTLAKNCLDNPASTDEELTAMYNRCVSFLRRKRIPGV